MALQTSGSMPDLGRIPSALPVGRWFEWCQGPEPLGGHLRTYSERHRDQVCVTNDPAILASGRVFERRLNGGTQRGAAGTFVP